MSNHAISHGKTVFDIFNIINPNCYQAFIIQCIIENKKEEAIQYCNELLTAFEYYKWDSSSKQSSYIDSLICESNFEKWQKFALIYIVSNDVKHCKEVIENEIKAESAASAKRYDFARDRSNKINHANNIEDLYKLFGFGQLL